MNSTQLELVLHDVRLRIPWAGQSPRDLTRARLSGIFKAQAGKSASVGFVDPFQLELALRSGKGPRASPGAPLLIPLLEEEVCR